MGNDPSATLEISQTWHAKDGEIAETGVTTSDHQITAADPAQVHIFGTPKKSKMVFTGRFTGKAGLYFEPTPEGCEFVCSNGISDTTGDITVTNATFRLVGGAAFTSVTAASFGDGAVLAVEEGCMFRAKSLDVDGSAVADGIYIGAPWYEGDGIVVVGDLAGDRTDAVWTGSGSDPLITTPGNWQGGVVPDLASGKTFVTVAGGSEMKVPAGADYAFYGISLESGAAFSFTAEAGARPVNIAEGGVTFDAVEDDCCVYWPIRFISRQTWEIPANRNVRVYGVLSGCHCATFVKNGLGRIHLYGENTFAGDFIATNSWTFSYATNALGGPGGTTTIVSQKDIPQFRLYGPQSHCRAIVLDTTNPSGGERVFFTYEGSSGDEVRFKKQLSTVNSCSLTLNIGSATVMFEDGLYTRGNTWIYGSGTLVVKGSPVYIPNRLTIDQQPTCIELHEKCNRLGIYTQKLAPVSGISKIKMMTDYAFDRTSTPVRVSTDVDRATELALGPRVTIDLNGYDQAIGNLLTVNGGTITSESPATMTLFDSQDLASFDGGSTGRVFKAAFTGAANFRKEGSNPYWIMSENSSTGSVGVAAGTLTFTSGSGGDVILSDGVTYPRSIGSWPNASEVFASGTGRLVVEHAGAFGRKTDVRISDSATIELADGVSMSCKRLMFGDEEQSAGTWGAVGNPNVSHTSPRFSGNGVLKVRGGGFVLSFK